MGKGATVRKGEKAAHGWEYVDMPVSSLSLANPHFPYIQQPCPLTSDDAITHNLCNSELEVEYITDNYCSVSTALSFNTLIP